MNPVETSAALLIKKSSADATSKQLRHASIAARRIILAKPATKKTAALTGNKFEFFLPKVTTPKPKSTKHPATSEKTDVMRKAIAPKRGRALKLTAAERIAKYFELLPATDPLHAQLGTGLKIIQAPDLLRAALECGYGRRSNWTSDLALNATEATDLSAYLLSRLEMVTNCLEAPPRSPQSIRWFHRRIEASEKVAISFILGGICTYLAAEMLLKAKGDLLDLFLHVGLYTKSFSAAKPLIISSGATTKSLPDYIAVTSSNELHLFESKGGNSAARYERILSGLKQLTMAPALGWSGPKASAVESFNCAHTSVDAGKPLRVMIVDPPARTKGSQSDDKAPKVPYLIPSVARLLIVLETVEYFKALGTGQMRPEPPVDLIGYRVSESPLFGGMVVGVPAVFLHHESTIRERLSAFLAVREVLDLSSFQRLNETKTMSSRSRKQKALEKHVRKKLGIPANAKSSARSNTASEESATTAEQPDSPTSEGALALALALVEKDELIPRLAEYLQLDTLAREVVRPLGQIGANTVPNSGGKFTTGGLWLKASEAPRASKG